MSLDFNKIYERLKTIPGLKNKAKIAESIHIKPAALTNYKKKNKWPIETLHKLAVKHNLSMDWLLTGEGPMRREDEAGVPTVKEEAHLDPATAEILRLTREIMQSDTSYADALSTNVVHFHRAVMAERKAKEGELTNSDVANELKKMRQELKTMLGYEDIAELASGNFSLASFLKVFLERVMRATGAKIGSILIKDPISGNFRIAAAKSEGNGPRHDEIITIENTIMRHAVNEMEPLVVEDIEKHPLTQQQNKPRYGSPSFMSVPIVERDECRGVINLAGKDQLMVFSQDDKGIVVKMLPEVMAALAKQGGLPKGIFNQ
jgi:putative methionine-R-sulfoxide reductase with GAF domain